MNKRPLSERKIQVFSSTAKKTTETRVQRKLRTAAYCRVSTDSKEQEVSYESQVLYYTNLIQENPKWEFVGIYAEQDVSGTSRRNRSKFDEMIYDCIHGKIDQVITKSMTRFARNQLDALAVIRLFQGLNPPVTILFEDDKISTTDLSAELLVTIYSMLAEQESAKKSTSVKWGFERRKEQGHYLTPTQNLLGYDKTKHYDKDQREIIIVEEEAKTVRLIFLMFLTGYKVSEIAYILTQAQVPTGKGNLMWNGSSVLGILKNERYAGDVRTNKYYTPNYRNHKVVKNNGEIDYIYETDHHIPIVPHEQYEMAQKLIASHKYGYDIYVTGAFTLKVIDEGLFKGFIPFNIHWAGSTLEEYIELSKTIENQESIKGKIKKVECYPGFEVVRSQDIGHIRKSALKITPSTIMLNKACMSCIKSDYIEILFHPTEKLLAIRETTQNEAGAIRWKQFKEGKEVPLTISCKCLTRLLYELMEWKVLWNMSILGQSYTKNKQTVLFFDLTQQEINALPYPKPKKKKKKESTDVYYDIEAMIAQQIELLHNKQYGDSIIPDEDDSSEEELPPPKRKKFHPFEWMESFGRESGIAAIACRRYEFSNMKEWKVQAKGVVVPDFDYSVSISDETVQGAIDEILETKNVEESLSGT